MQMSEEFNEIDRLTQLVCEKDVEIAQMRKNYWTAADASEELADLRRIKAALTRDDRHSTWVINDLDITKDPLLAKAMLPRIGDRVTLIGGTLAGFVAVIVELDPKNRIAFLVPADELDSSPSHYSFDDFEIEP